MEPALTLEFLENCAENHARVQRIFEGAPAYALCTEGKLPGERDGAELFESLAPNGRASDKSVFSIRENGSDVGVIDIYRRWNTPTKAMIGLLLLVESAQGRGLGARAYELLRMRLIEEYGTQFETLRIGVIETNTQAFPFWRKLGFTETGERKRSDEFIDDVILLERPLV
jgi:RimJ/RimL family protein N-acetyltransferase